MRTPLFRTLTWTLAPFLLGCGDSTGPEEPDEQVIPCTEQIGSVDVTVSDGLTPTFSWSPACGVAMILIEEDASDMWGAGTDEDAWSDPAAANLITPPGQLRRHAHRDHGDSGCAAIGERPQL
jgi:hypothetical protein